MRFDYFFAINLDADELDSYLQAGWRKFGAYYFKPACPDCAECVPIRIPVNSFTLSKGHRRLLAKSADIEVKFRPLSYSDNLFRIYRDHSEKRFSRIPSKDEFMESFFYPSCPSLQSEYYLDGSLAAAGFIDHSKSGLSSVYFVYLDEYKKYSLGTLSILMEIEKTKELGLDYYYLGYYVAENSSMSYKNSFHPNEKYSWTDAKWFPDK